MGLNDTPKSDRVHIAVFGKRNAGKSSLINSITGQNLSIVSDVLGTTTDPVYKAMELLPLGPVMMIDTPGLDDEGELGRMRMKKAMLVLNKSDIAVLVLDALEFEKECPDVTFEQDLYKLIQEKKIPCVVVMNKTDLVENWREQKLVCYEWLKDKFPASPVMDVSAEEKRNIFELKELLGKQVPSDDTKQQIVGDLLKPKDVVVLVVPIDSAAPKGRLILPQQQTIRDILESDAISIVTKETELKDTLASLKEKPKLVITDSQAFAQVSKDTPEDVMLTSFSILFSRYKGNLKLQVAGAKALETLSDGDKILMAEGCTHHRQCDDIGTVKMPRWIEKYTGKKLVFETSSGMEFPENLTDYKMIVHCGGCMLNKREMQFRLKQAEDMNVPIVNYGVLIAYMNGILKRTLTPFPESLKLLEK